MGQRELSKQFHDPEIEFIDVKAGTKTPCRSWTEPKNLLSYKDIRLIEHVKNEGNVSALAGGKGNLICIDGDTPELSKKLEEMNIDTYTDKSGNRKCIRLLFKSDFRTEKASIKLKLGGDLITHDHLIMISPSQVDERYDKFLGRDKTDGKYEIVKDVPIKWVSKEDFLKLFKDILEIEEKTKEIKSEKDKSPSGVNFRKVMSVIREGCVTFEEVDKRFFKEEDAYWMSKPDSYKKPTYETALKFVMAGKSNKEEITYTDEEKSDALDVLKDPKLCDNIVKEIQKKVVGETTAIKTITLVSIVSKVKNAQATSSDLTIDAESGSGKDFVLSNTLGIFPKSNCIQRTRISATALTYWHANEDDWTWDGKILGLEDISTEILNCDVFKCMASGKSEATITKDQQAIDLIVKGKPSLIITTAYAIPDRELARRFVNLPLDETEDQTLGIMMRQAKEAETGEKIEYDKKFTVALDLLERVEVVIPFASRIMPHLPHENIVMRTQCGRFLDYIKGSACLHQFQRERNDNGQVIAAGQDYDIARECFFATIKHPSMITLCRGEEEILRAFETLNKEQGFEGEYTYVELNNKTTFEDKTLRKYISILLQKGIIHNGKPIKNENSGRSALTFRYTPLRDVSIPTWELIDGIDGKAGKDGKAGIDGKGVFE